MGGKRISRERIPEQIRMDEEMSSNLRLIAQANRRSVPMQILDFVDKGIKEHFDSLRHNMSQPQSAQVTNGHSRSERSTA